jgi:microcystin-dependent protein
MAEPFLSEIRIMSVPSNWIPRGWALCNGQLLPINQNQALFSLLGTTFGGNGQTTFALPDLRGRAPLHVGANHTLGELGGEYNHTLSISETPQHTHSAAASTAATGGTASPNNNYLGGGNNVYAAPNAGPLTTMRPDTITNVGGSQPHNNTQPYLVLHFMIALIGIFPSAT